MRHEEIRDTGQIASDALAGGVRLVEDVHMAVAERVFRRVGDAGHPARAVHDAITTMVYGTVRGAHRVLPRVAATIVTTAVPSARSIHDSPQGLPVLAAVNGLWGDRIAARAPTLAIPMSIRLDGRDLVPTAADVRVAVANSTPRLAVFVHGLCETDRSWTRPRPDTASPAAAATYGDGLRSDLGYTPLLVRYNTGLHVSENGRALALLLERIVEAWPLVVQEVVLVGHSMGGLVARSACHYGDLDGSTWASRVRHVVSLGTPHLGAPLEKATNVAGWALARWPESVPFARLLIARSAGVKDLRFGAVIDDDWQGHDPDEFLRDRCREVPFLTNAHYYFVGATIGRDPAGLAGRVLGDLLVRLPSASGDGRHRRIPFEIDHGHHLIGVNHFDLLNHPAVYDQLHQWLATARTDRPSTSLTSQQETPRSAEASSGRAETA